MITTLHVCFNMTPVWLQQNSVRFSLLLLFVHDKNATQFDWEETTPFFGVWFKLFFFDTALQIVF